ncbi:MULTISPECIES: hypothetical protein [Burkholderia]|uniref:hypothetical protein n=1 Tax=Burkholderia TaxID=32008 RepID=UPI000F53B870|nr:MULTISPECIES: hypothetical protein [Burkholderia]RQM59657.1 hypothetical protein EHZ18_08975 [Burkholderia vietnamiensis]
MLKLLCKNAIRSPFKVLALCMVVYIASMSLFVVGLLVLIAGNWLRGEIAKQRTAMQEAEAAERAEAADAARLVKQRAAANDDVAEPTTPSRQYAKSAVVRPLETGSR